MIEITNINIQTYTYKDLNEAKELHKKLYEAMASIDDYNVFINSLGGIGSFKSFAIKCLLGVKQYIRNNCFLCDYATDITKENKDDMLNVCPNCPAFKEKFDVNGPFYCESCYKPYAKLNGMFHNRLVKGKFSEEETKEIRELCLKISKLFDGEEVNI